MLATLLLAGALAAERPNIVWLTSEDHGPHFPCYGTAYANTPTAERLAKSGTRFSRAWSCAPVCAPARTTLISGLHPTSTGSEHMRSMLPYPAGKQMFPQLLREAGYWTANNQKEDYNLAHSGKVWDASSRTAHWRGRPEGQPFFAVFNSTKSHESQSRKRPHQAKLDPAKVRVPAYQPDLPDVRRDWAQYHDQVAEADADAGKRLQELEAAGLLDQTIVFYFADHGPGLPRCKRWPGDSGLHVPLLIHVPERFRHLAPDLKPGGVTDRLVSFADFGPTVLSLAGLKPPAWMHGRAFLGPHAAAPPEFVFGFRGRMDEAHDHVRSASDGRWVYLRNYRPDRPAGQAQDYMFQTPTTRAWKAAFDTGKLPPEHAAFFLPKPAEELYDLSTDRDEVKNLAADPQHAAALARMRKALADHQSATRDVGFLPEGEYHRRKPGANPLDWSSDDAAYPFAKCRAAAENASLGKTDPAALADAEPAVRYWTALGLALAGDAAVRASAPALKERFQDKCPEAAIAAAYALALHGADADRAAGRAELLRRADRSKNDFFATVAALQCLQHLGAPPADARAAIAALPAKANPPSARMAEYIPRILKTLRGEP